ncbi:MAG TPA: replicative DNA helicase [Pirellulaceae bacterium]|nr:replicative DNA helicase [Pirellulaceae bacterium]HMO93177.1 replicative DNA helicase [Pirellulaceae bacterium]HMP69994.1 replicative DNA helicase [Pirellulaceae bacterium]
MEQPSNKKNFYRKQKEARPRVPTPDKLESDLLARNTPFSLEAERALLGSVMLMPDTLDDVTTIVRVDDFYDDANQIIYRYVQEMYNTGRKIDPMLLRQSLKDGRDLDSVGGETYLAQVFTQVPHAAHATFYAKIVEEKSIQRQLIFACTDILKEAYEPKESSAKLIGEAEQKIFSIRENRQSNSLSSIDSILHEAMDRLEARMSGEPMAGTIETGFVDLDKLTGGLHASELVILAARPSMGKTAFAMNIAENVACDQNKPVLFVSLEMSAIELIERMLCSRARVNSHRLRSRTLDKGQRKKLSKMAGELSRVPLHIDDSPTRTVSEIAATARRIKRKCGELGLIVIDYLQLVEPDNSSDPRQEQVAKIARRLKGMARELKVPVLCLSQLNRQAEDAKEHRPRLHHLRESGAIEQDADVVMFVHRKEYFLTGEARDEVAGEAQILVEKQRNGPTGEVDLTWVRDFTRFDNRALDSARQFDEYPDVEFDFN